MRKFFKTFCIIGILSAGIAGISLAQETSPADSTQKDSAQLTRFSQNIPGTPVYFTMVLIPGGEYVMGSAVDGENQESDEAPAHKVIVDSFWMGQFEVRFDEYEIYRERDRDKDTTAVEGLDYKADAVTRPSPPYEDPTFGMGKYGYPAASMTQFAALKYCKWLTTKTGRFFRLPTEAEWEYACRAGSDSDYYFGNDTSQLAEYAWYEANSEETYHKCGEKKANAWGLYDMYGNVAEWTLDQYQEDFYAAFKDSLATNPWRQPNRLHPRTVKGGSYEDGPEAMRSANRIRSDMAWKRRDPQIPKSFWWNTDSPFVGFRIVSPYKELSAEEIKKFWKMTLDE